MLTIKEVENIVNHVGWESFAFNMPDGSSRSYDVEEIVRQLLAVMNENKELKKHPLKLICEKCNILTDVTPNKHPEPDNSIEARIKWSEEQSYIRTEIKDGAEAGRTVLPTQNSVIMRNQPGYKIEDIVSYGNDLPTKHSV